LSGVRSAAWRECRAIEEVPLSRTVFIAVAVSVAVIGLAASDAGQAAAQVREAETAFAKTMADRDWQAFTAFISQEAVFFGRQRVLRGREAVAAGWKPYFDAPQAPFSWAPEQVEVLESGTLALSSGPVFGPGGERSGTFMSVWRLEADGRWRIVFDKGC
jgi:ketosteroid isomerase-like protein